MKMHKELNGYLNTSRIRSKDRFRKLAISHLILSSSLKKDSLKELPHKIDHYGAGIMVKFSAKMSDLLCAKTTRDIKKGRRA